MPALTKFRAAEDQRANGPAPALIRMALDASPMAIALVRTDGEIGYLNERFISLFDANRADLATMDARQLSGWFFDQLILPDRAREVMRALQQNPTMSFSEDLKLEDGRTLEAHSYPLIADGDPIGRAWCLRDVTERVSASEDTGLNGQLLESHAREMAELAERYYHAQAESDAARAKLEEQQAELERLANTDDMTGVLNRRKLLFDGAGALRRCQAKDEPLSLIMLDIDHFKRINDTFGHAVGDAAIITVASTARDQLGKTDFFGRFGGEEFAAILPGRTLDEAAALAEQIRQAIEQTPVNCNQPDLRLTISLGVTQVAPDALVLDDAIKKADDALYRAKGAGRNRVDVAPV